MVAGDRYIELGRTYGLMVMEKWGGTWAFWTGLQEMGWARSVSSIRQGRTQRLSIVTLVQDYGQLPCTISGHDDLPNKTFYILYCGYVKICDAIYHVPALRAADIIADISVAYRLYVACATI